MSAFGSGFGGFGQSANNNQQSTATGFGGFGQNNNTNTGFGQQQNTGFGASTNNTGGGLFGTGGTTFGSNTGTSAFGANKPTFGAATNSTGVGLFGASTQTGGTGFGGFGSNNSASNTASPFGATNTGAGGGIFGNTANKTSFGSTTNTGSGLFGGGTGGGGGFGQTNTQPTGLFGAAQGTALSTNTADCQGTGSTPFQSFIEKDTPGGSNNHFQSVSFMQPYQKFSFEELRSADYNQGRRYGNASGQAGAFGTSTNFGGFGTSSTASQSAFGAPQGGLFGSQNTTTASPFGGTTQTTGFGNSANTGTGIFGTKQSGSGLFGGTTTTTAQPANNVFGTTGPTGFGTQQNTGFGNTGSSLFGNTAQTQKPPFGNFGNTNTNTTTGAFGTTSGSNNLFGSNNQTGGFGTQPQTANPTPFGQNTQTQNQTGFGSGFGANNNSTTSRPSLFGNTTTGTGGSNLFGNTGSQTSNLSGSTLFGNSSTQPNGGSVFGNNPTATGTANLFGANNTTTTNNQGSAPFGGFGNTNQNQQNQGSNLFGANNTSKPSLFSNNTNNRNSLFGTNNNNQQNNPGGSLFGTSTNNQNQQNQTTGPFGNPTVGSTSIFGNGQQQNQLQPPRGLSASLLDQNPYGSSSIYGGLPPPPQINPGPVATPISAGKTQKKKTPLPMYKLNPPTVQQYVTPQKRGYGFSYSTYGTPSSAASTYSTPGGLAGLSGSLLGSSIGRSLGKSFSTSNLRRSFDSDGDSILSPGAFSATSTRHAGQSSLKKLTIDRSLRTDLFNSPPPLPALLNTEPKQPSILKKKVSFDTNTFGGRGNGTDTGTGSASGGAAVIDSIDEGDGTECDLANNPEKASTSNSIEQGQAGPSSRSQSRSNGVQSNGAGPTPQPETKQIKGDELTLVPDGDPGTASKIPSIKVISSRKPGSVRPDVEPGAYYTKPSIEELSRLPAEQLKRFSGFIIGREGCGHVHFDEPVNLTEVPLDKIFGRIAHITTRSLTIYPHNDDKPPVGRGLNVPSTITLGNSWPRTRDRRTPTYEVDSSKLEKHIDRLRKVGGTEFVTYNREAGEWVFKVPHFTTYALIYDDDDTSVLSELPDTPTPAPRSLKERATPMPPQAFTQGSSGSSKFYEEDSRISSELDDTFEFQRQRLLPGAFDDIPPFEAEDDQAEEEVQQNGEHFLEERSAASYSDNERESSDFDGEMEDVDEKSLVMRDDEMDMAGSFPRLTDNLEDPFATDSVFMPRSILRETTQLGQSRFGTPPKVTFEPDSDWSQQLLRTISPKKQDRQALREIQAKLFDPNVFDQETRLKVMRSNQGDTEFATSIDLMNSLFGREEARKSGRAVKGMAEDTGFKWPYAKKPTTQSSGEMSNEDRQFHESYKPRWAPKGILLYGIANNDQIHKPRRSRFLDTKNIISSTVRNIKVAKFTNVLQLIPENLRVQRANSGIDTDHSAPLAISKPIPFKDLAAGVPEGAEAERQIWELASILFDDYSDEISSGVPESQQSMYADRIRKDRLSVFWEDLCQKEGFEAVATATTTEERALANLTMHRVMEACDNLLEGKDFRLATMMAQIGGDEVIQEDMKTQLDQWRSLKALSEMTEPIRALYELLAGNAYVCEGYKGALEDMAKTFTISERLNLDWRRAFGLRLWYAIRANEPLEGAVDIFTGELLGKETSRPVPCYAEKKLKATKISSSGASSPHSAARSDENGEDVLWGLLKVYASSKSGDPLRLAEAVLPTNITKRPFDSRLSFQLYYAIKTRFPDARLNQVEADRFANEFALELDSANEWIWAVFVLLHLSNDADRQSSLQSLIQQHAADIGNADSKEFDTLVNQFKIPEAWIWEAKALYARSASQDHITEVSCLLRAKNWNEAHTTFCRIVAPKAIIEQDYALLQNLLNNFPSQNNDIIDGWAFGGQAYEDYLQIIPGGFGGGSGKHQALKRLIQAIPNMVKDLRQESSEGALDEKIALQEMSAVVGQAILAEKDGHHQTVGFTLVPQSISLQILADPKL
ncbi:MAG: Nuclear pore complex protein Nup98-Nup96 [Icmadophila ericetorum]|nr:Nuclear pore complex protein Nup98-Nup96 [Icmadophila ericetorum]